MKALFRALRSSRAICAAASVLIFLAPGCSKQAGDAAIRSDANGYICPKCNLKFYTDREVNAEFCPKCKDVGIVEVVGYFCDKDSHTTLNVRTRAMVVCEKCQGPAPAIRLPHADELQAWGATKQTREEVCKH